MSQRKDSFHFYVPECEEDTGNWVPLQQDSNGTRWCVDPSTGEVLSEKSDRLASCEGCLMSRLVKMLDIRRVEKAGATVNNVYFPECQDDYPEYYETKQCWSGYFNACWCVHDISGQATKFPSENEVDCDGDISEELKKPNSISWCQILESLVASYNAVYSTVVNRRFGIDATQQKFSEPDIAMEIRCEERSGNFVNEQCLDGECWCVDGETGHLQEECDTDRHRIRRSDRLCRRERAEQLEAYYAFVLRGVILEHFTIPACTSEGEWESLQCSNQTVNGGSQCWCVDKITGHRSTGASSTLKFCDSCRAHVLRADKAQIQDYTTCDETGRYYTTIQCNHDECWCTDHVTGLLLSTSHQRVTGEDCEILDKTHQLKSGNGM